MKYQVMLVEDEPKTAEMVIMALESEDKIKITHFDNGVSAIENFEEMGIGYYDLLILDLKLKGELRGDEALDEIRKIDPYVEVLVYTNYENPEELKHLLNLRVSGYEKKGADADIWSLVEKVNTILEPMSQEERENFLNTLPNNPLSTE